MFAHTRQVRDLSLTKLCPNHFRPFSPTFCPINMKCKARRRVKLATHIHLVSTLKSMALLLLLHCSILNYNCSLRCMAVFTRRQVFGLRIRTFVSDPVLAGCRLKKLFNCTVFISAYWWCM